MKVQMRLGQRAQARVVHGGVGHDPLCPHRPNPKVGLVRIATWNVNSVGARLPRLNEWLELAEPDVLCLQETKIADDAFPSEGAEALGYEIATNGDGRWNGVAILSRVGLTDVSRGFAGQSAYAPPPNEDDPALVGSTHVTEAERKALTELRALGLHDVIPRAMKHDTPYTYWDYRAGMFHKNMGMRIDLVYASDAAASSVKDAYIDRDARKGKG